jgi:hypothetical protein
MANCEEFIGNTKYLTLCIRCCINRCRYNRVRLYIFKNGGSEYRSRYSDSLRVGRSGDRIPMGTRCSAPAQTSPGA